MFSGLKIFVFANAEIQISNTSMSCRILVFILKKVNSNYHSDIIPTKLEPCNSCEENSRIFSTVNPNVLFVFAENQARMLPFLQNIKHEFSSSK